MVPGQFQLFDHLDPPNDKPIELLDETKLLGTVITTDLRWNRNTEEITKKAYSRMQILRKIVEFNPKLSDMVTIYISYIRSILEQSCQVWHSSLTQNNTDDLERVQKSAFQTILGESYNSYEHALDKLNMDTLVERREKLCLRFAESCLSNEKTKNMFPINKKKNMKTRNREQFQVHQALTSRLKNSSIPYMQKLLNQKYATIK